MFDLLAIFFVGFCVLVSRNFLEALVFGLMEASRVRRHRIAISVSIGLAITTVGWVVCLLLGAASSINEFLLCWAVGACAQYYWLVRSK